MSESANVIYGELLNKIKETESLITQCQNLPDIAGKSKLQRKIEAELRFLKKLTKNHEKLKEEHIRSSNIYHLSAIVKCCHDMKGVTKVLETFSYFSSDLEQEYEKSLVVDVVADYGKTWVKVASRNPLHLYQASIGLGKYGRKSIVEQVHDIVECASQNQHIFVSPKVIVRLAAGVTKELKELLDNLNAEVVGDIVDQEPYNVDENLQTNSGGCSIEHLESLTALHLSNDSSSSIDAKECQTTSEIEHIEHSNDCFFNLQSIPKDAVLNLDVSTFLAYVSNMTNGHAHANYKEKLLTDLAIMEQANPVKIVLDQLFKNRKLVCCETAHKDFMEILSTVGGEEEKKRSIEILNKVEMVEDNPSSKALYLEKTSKIKDRARIVFGTGDSMKAVTVSANLGFLRAAQSQGIKFVAFVHESRALTECKELPA